jgi:DNA polymerase-3 subunit delta
MTPQQFLEQLEKRGPAPAYLFLGAEPYLRRKCRAALLAAALPEGDRESGYAHYDLSETPLAAALDDARSLSLFATRRVLWVAAAEAALPRRLASAAEQDGEEGAAARGGPATLAGYVQHPAPGTVVVLECSRWEFEGEDAARLERVRKFYAAVPQVVEFRSFTLEAARSLAQRLAKDEGVRLGPAELGLLVEAAGGDAQRIACEITKLALLTNGERAVTAEDILALVPNAQAASIFSLVAALGRGDRLASLSLLDSLVRDGEYLPLVLTYLGTQFRFALAAREARLHNAAQIQSHFTRLGARMWRERAEDIARTAAAFAPARLEEALVRIFEADRALRDARPDDRVVLERLVFALT